jgi:hypothetical protein
LTTEITNAGTINTPICGKLSGFCLPKKSDTKGKLTKNVLKILKGPH